MLKLKVDDLKDKDLAEEIKKTAEELCNMRVGVADLTGMLGTMGDKLWTLIDKAFPEFRRPERNAVGWRYNHSEHAIQNALLDLDDIEL